MTFDVDVNGRVRRVEVEPQGDGYVVTVDGHRHVVDVTVIAGVWSLILEPAQAGPYDSSSDVGSSSSEVGAGFSRPGTRRSYEVAVVADKRASDNLIVHVNGRVVTVTVGATPRSLPAGPTPVASGFAGRRGRGSGEGGSRNGSPDAGSIGPHRVTAPMPGKVVRVLARPGDQVAARQSVIVVEAMKMENELRSPKAGTVAEVRVAEGSSVEAGAVLVVIE